MGKDGRRSPVELIGPVGLKKMVKGLCAIIPELPYRLQMKEIENREADYRLDKLRIEAFRVDHSVPCYGYAFYLDRAPRFEPDKARALGIAPQYWGKLQKGERLTVEGKTICPDMVLGEERKGIHFTYVTDTRPAVCIRRFAKESDLLICEGMYGDEDKKEMALLKRHMLFREAAEIAREAGVKELWLTHYSPSLHDPGSYAEACKAIFPYLVAAEDLQSVTLCFPKQ